MSAAPARIGFVTTSFPRHEDDPAGSFVLGMARALARRGHTVEVIAPEPDRPAQWDDPRAGWLGGVRVVAAPYARPAGLQRLFYGAGVPDNLSRSPALAALVPGALAGLYLTARRRARGWSAVVSHWLVPSALVASAARRSLALTHLAIAHSADVHLLSRLPLGNRVARLAIDGADRVGFVADGLRRRLAAVVDPADQKLLDGRFALTPMGVDSEQLRAARPRERLREELGLGGFAVLFLGRLVPIKGLDVLIEALGPCTGLQLVVAGEGPLRETLEQRARAQGLDARFLGVVGPRRRAELLQACDVLALPSRRLEDGRQEGLPLAVVESMAAGLPVVATDTGAVAELVDNGRSGLLVPADTPVALAAELTGLARDPGRGRRLAAAARDSVADRDWSRLAPKYEALLGVGGTGHP
jgi:glycosyltransferase involved in cell wall biosynthesis